MFFTFSFVLISIWILPLLCQGSDVHNIFWILGHILFFKNIFHLIQVLQRRKCSLQNPEYLINKSLFIE